MTRLTFLSFRSWFCLCFLVVCGSKSDRSCHLEFSQTKRFYFAVGWKLLFVTPSIDLWLIECWPFCRVLNRFAAVLIWDACVMYSRTSPLSSLPTRLVFLLLCRSKLPSNVDYLCNGAVQSIVIVETFSGSCLGFKKIVWPKTVRVLDTNLKLLGIVKSCGPKRHWLMLLPGVKLWLANWLWVDQ